MRVQNAQELGHVIRERRRHLGQTQVQLARRARVSRRWLSDLEAGKTTAEVGLVLRTLLALGLSVNLIPAENTGPVNLDDYLEQLRTRARKGLSLGRPEEPS